jgi:hypothetical protein
MDDFDLAWLCDMMDSGIGFSMGSFGSILGCDEESGIIETEGGDLPAADVDPADITEDPPTWIAGVDNTFVLLGGIAVLALVMR